MLGALYAVADRLRQRGRKRSMALDLALGRKGEDLAHRYLQAAGFVIVARNYTTVGKSGEIDLIGRDGEALVFIEVKSRSTAEYGAPDRAVGPEKQATLIRVARQYSRRAEVPWERVRFDVVTVVFSTPPEIHHYRTAFPTPRGTEFTELPAARPRWPAPPTEIPSGSL